MTRTVTTQDFKFIYGLYFHPDVNRYLLYEPMSEEKFREIFAELLEQQIFYIYEDAGVAIGMFKLIPLKHRTSHIAYLGGLAIDPAAAGKGHGTSMLQEILAMASARGFLRVELSVSIENERAIHLYEKAGFVKEGLLRKYSYLPGTNEFMDELLMAWLS